MPQCLGPLVQRIRYTRPGGHTFAWSFNPHSQWWLRMPHHNSHAPFSPVPFVPLMAVPVALPRLTTRTAESQHRPLDRMPLFDMFLEARHGPSPDRAVGAFKCCHYLRPLHGEIPAKPAHSRCFITKPHPAHRASDPTSVIRISVCPLRSGIARILQHPLVGVCRDARRVKHPAHGDDQAANARPNEAHDDGDD